MFHVQVKCEDCEQVRRTIEWTLNAHAISNSSRAVVLPNKFIANKNILKVTVRQGDLVGESFMIISPENIPTGNCRVDPTTGYEFETNFFLLCDSSAANFEVYQQEKLIGKFYSSPFQTRLMETTSIRVKLVDILGAQNFFELPVAVKKLIIVNVTSFIIEGAKNPPLHVFVASKDFPSAAIMISTAIDNMNMNETKLAQRLITDLDEVEFVASESVVIMAAVLKKFCDEIPTDHVLRLIIGKLLKKIAKEMNQPTMFDFDEAKNLAKNLISIARNLSSPVSIMESQQSEQASLHERLDIYEDYEEFDLEIIDKINNFLSVGNEVEALMTSLLRFLAEFVEPTEPNIEINLGNAKLIVAAKDFEEFPEPENFTLHGSIVELTRTEPIDIVKLGIISFETENPFWFVREKAEVLSNFLSIALMNEKGKEFKQLSKQITITPKFTESTSRIVLKEPKYQSVCVESSNDMPTFSVKTLPSSVILIKFQVADGRSLSYFSQFNKRPLLKDFKLKPENVKVIEGTTVLKVETMREREKFFISFLSRENGNCTNLTIEFIELSCNIWNEHFGAWYSKYCRVSDVINSTSFTCQCNKLGSFIASVKNIRATFESPRKIQNELKQNFIVLMIFLNLILAAASIILWFHKEPKRKLILLRSNHPKDSHKYIVTTSSKDSRSSVEVCLKIIGSSGATGTLWLNDDDSDKQREKNFLVTTPTSLGEIVKVHVWVKPFGAETSWNCKRILIQSQDSRSWLFEIKRPFKFSVDESTEIFRELESISLQNKMKIFTENLRESSLFSRREKLILVLKTIYLLLISGSVSCFLLSPTTWINVEEEQTTFEEIDLKLVLKNSSWIFILIAPIYVFLSFLQTENSATRKVSRAIY